MKLHTKLEYVDVRNALGAAKLKDKVGYDVNFVILKKATSKSHPNGWMITLGSTEERPTGTDNNHKRRFRNKGTGPDKRGDFAPYAATWDEWGWFMAEVYNRDPNAKIGSYRSEDDFHGQTMHKYDERIDT